MTSTIRPRRNRLYGPFALDELACRVLALCRRVGWVAPPALELGRFVLDASRCVVYEDGTVLDLTAKEYKA